MSSFYSTAYRASEYLNEEATSTSKRGLSLTWVDSRPLIYAAVVSAVICCFIAFSDLRDHLSRFDYPKLQVLEMRIILMVPIYAIFSSLSLIFTSWRFFFETIRDTYESFVLYMFFMLMVAYCGGEGQLLRSLKQKRYKGVHPFPMCWLPSFPLDTTFFLRCKRWVLQCALIKPVCSFMAMVCSPLGIYREDSFGFDNVYTYSCIIVNFSLTWALYYLVLFEIECEKELHYAKTFLKFLCIKSIIFFSYWQSVAVSIAIKTNLVYVGDTKEQEEHISSNIQNLLMCFELLPVVFLHRYAFGRDKLDEEMNNVPIYMKDENEGNLRTNVDTALNVNDIIEDTIGTILYRRGKLVDQENGEESDEDTYDVVDNPAPHKTKEADGVDILAQGRDPTVEELVRHAIISDDGVRVDGVLHFDEESDRDERNLDMNFTDRDVILRRSRKGGGGEAIHVDADILRANQQDTTATPQIYCVVCGRFDREMVRRRNGYKCKACVGTKSQSLLRHRQREQDHGGVAETNNSLVRSSKVAGGSHDVVIQDIHDSASDQSDESNPYIQPIPEEPDADLVGVQLPEGATNLGITGGLNNINNMLRSAFLPGSAPSPNA